MVIIRNGYKWGVGVGAGLEAGGGRDGGAGMGSGDRCFFQNLRFVAIVGGAG